MKFVTAIIKPFKLDDLKDSLQELGLNGVTVTEVKGYGRQKGHTEMYRGAEYTVDFIPKVKVELAISDDRVNEVIDTICTIAGSGKVGDGKIFVTNLEECVRIRTREMGEDAL